jgi:hypothetical protein
MIDPITHHPSLVIPSLMLTLIPTSSSSVCGIREELDGKVQAKQKEAEELGNKVNHSEINP